MSLARDCLLSPWLFIPLLLATRAFATEGPVRPNAELGKRIYRDGVLPSGKPVQARVQGDIAAEGATFSCATCHRRSGLGSGEGGAYVLAVTASYLFRAREPDRGGLFRSLYQEVQSETVQLRLRDPRLRPAYTDASLRNAIREGRDPTGRSLDALMPCYELGEEDIGHPVAYLRQLGTQSPPGADERAIHFATIVTEGVEPDKSAAMLEVMRAYLARKNANTRAQLERPGFSLW